MTLTVWWPDVTGLADDNVGPGRDVKCGCGERQKKKKRGLRRIKTLLDPLKTVIIIFRFARAFDSVGFLGYSRKAQPVSVVIVQSNTLDLTCVRDLEAVL